LVTEASLAGFIGRNAVRGQGRFGMETALVTPRCPIAQRQREWSNGPPLGL